MFARKQDEARWDLQTNYLSVSVYMKTDTDTVFKMSFSFYPCSVQTKYSYDDSRSL
jgi:hypothetical protein